MSELAVVAMHYGTLIKPVCRQHTLHSNQTASMSDSDPSGHFCKSKESIVAEEVLAISI